MPRLWMLIWGMIAVVSLPAAGTAQDPLPVYPENYHVILENDHVRVLDFVLRKGAKEMAHSHPAHVVYVVTGFKIRFTYPDGRTLVRETKAGDVLYSDAVTHASENIGETGAHGILVELKTGVARQTGGTLSGSLEDVLTAVTFIRGRPGTGDSVKQELLTLTAPTRAEGGNLTYDLYQSVDQADSFMRFEVWRNAGALERHKATPHLQASFERRKNAGWKTEITRWHRVAEEADEERAALAR